MKTIRIINNLKIYLSQEIPKKFHKKNFEQSNLLHFKLLTPKIY